MTTCPNGCGTLQHRGDRWHCEQCASEWTADELAKPLEASDDALSRRFREVFETDAMIALAFVLEAREPPSAEAVEWVVDAVLERHPERRDIEYDTEDLERMASYFERVPTPDGQVGYRFNHSFMPVQSLRESERLAPFVNEVHDILTEAALHWREDDGGPLRSYLLEYGIHHAVDSNQQERAVELLRDLSFVESICREIGPSTLVELYHVAADVLEGEVAKNLRLMGRAVRRDETFLEQHPDRLFQQMYNRCWWYDTQEAKHHFVQPFKQSEPPPWERDGPRLCDWLDQWRETWERERGDAWAEARLPAGKRLEGEMVTQMPNFDADAHLKCAVLDESGEHIFASYSKDTVPERIYDARSGECVTQFEDDYGYVESAAFGQNGDWLVSGTWEGEVTARDVASGEVLATFDAHQSGIRSVDVGPNGHRIVSGDWDGAACLWSAEHEEVIAHFERHESSVEYVAFTLDGASIVSRDSEGIVRVWSNGDARERWRSNDRVPGVESISLGPGAQNMIVGCSDGTMRMLDIDTGDEQWQSVAHDQAIRHIEVGPRGRRVVSTAPDIVRVWDLQTDDEPIQCIQPPRTCREIRITENGDAVVALLAGSGLGDRNWEDKIECVHWHLDLGEPLERTPRHKGSPSSIAFSGDGSCIIAGSSDEVGLSARVWRVEDGRPLARLSGHRTSVTEVELDSEGRRAITGSRYGKTCVWSVKTGEKIHNLSLAHSSPNRFGVELHPERSEHLSMSEHVSFGSARSTTVRLWDAKLGHEVRRWNADDSLAEYDVLEDIAYHEPSGYLFLANRSDAIACSRDDSCDIDQWGWHRLRHGTLQSHDASTTAVAIDADCTYVVSGDQEGDIVVWGWSEQTTLHRFSGHAGRVRAIEVAPSGKHAVSVGDDGTMRLWALESGHESDCIQAHDRAARSVSIGACGRRAVTGGSDGMVRVWNLQTGRCIEQFDGHERRVLAVAYAPNSRYVVSGSDDSTARLWSLNDERPHVVLDRPRECVTALFMHPDGKRLTIGTAEGPVRTWDLDTGALVSCMHGHLQAIAGIDMGSKTGRLVTISGRHGRRECSNVRTRDIETGRDIERLDTMCHSGTEFAHHPPSGRLATHTFGPIVADTIRHIQVREPSDGESIELKRLDSNGIQHLTFGPQGTYLAANAHEGRIELWDVEHGREVCRLEAYRGKVTGLVFDEEERHLVSGHEDGHVRRWELQTGKKVLDLEAHPETISTLDIDASGQHVAWGSEAGTVAVWHLEAGDELVRFDEAQASIESVYLDSTGERLVAATQEVVRVWHVSNEKLMWKREDETGSLCEVAIDEPGTRVIAGSDADGRPSNTSGRRDGAVTIWQMETGEQLAHHAWYHLASIRSMALNPGERDWIVLAGTYALQLWDIEDGLRLRRFGDHNERINDVVFGPDGDRIASVDRDETVKVWNLESGVCERTLEDFSDPREAFENSEGVDSDESIELVEGDGKTIVRKQDSKVKEQVLTRFPYTFKGPVTASRDGEEVFAGRDDLCVYLYALRKPEGWTRPTLC